jgi:zinc D-Ala-D-Ala carboxypeptidase
MSDFEDIPILQRAAAPKPLPLAPVSPKFPLGVAVAIGAAVLLLVGGFGATKFLGSAVPAVQTAAISPSTASTPMGDTLLGHHRYKEVGHSKLVAIQGFPGSPPISIHRGALEQYRAMIKAAQRDGVILVPISGFRSEHYQQELYDRQLGKLGSVESATTINAPPGYSEHHTGYAIDFGDGTQLETNTKPSFEQTPAFAWLKEHAAKHGFEMSFAKDNPDRVSYEPWHWRFVGTRDALETFYQR